MTRAPCEAGASPLSRRGQSPCALARCDQARDGAAGQGDPTKEEEDAEDKEAEEEAEEEEGGGSRDTEEEEPRAGK